MIPLLVIAVLFLAYANGANDIFKGVARCMAVERLPIAGPWPWPW